MIKGIDHITINVKDDAGTKWFYEELLGLVPMNTMDMGDELIWYYRLSEDVRLELISYRTEQPAHSVPQKNLGSIRHFALECDGLERLSEKCKQHNIKVLMPLTRMEKLGCCGILIEDPNGIEVEIIEKIVV